jgi:methionyl-tRNA synthetase
VIYVWFDALINYYTGVNTEKLKDFWPTACHVVGKDITKFHCIIWPAMLMSAGIELYSEVFAHGFFTIDGHKMSKSFGNVVDPVELSDKFGNDALRVGTLSSFEFGNDGDFSLENFENFYNKKLAGGVGNLFNRVIVLVHKFLGGVRTQVRTRDEEAIKEFELLLEQKKIKAAIDHFFTVVDSANELLNETEVWKLAKVDLEASKTVFAELLQKLESLADMAEVILPESSPKMKKMLGDEKKVGEAEILFVRGERVFFESRLNA